MPTLFALLLTFLSVTHASEEESWFDLGEPDTVETRERELSTAWAKQPGIKTYRMGLGVLGASAAFGLVWARFGDSQRHADMPMWMLPVAGAGAGLVAMTTGATLNSQAAERTTLARVVVAVPAVLLLSGLVARRAEPVVVGLAAMPVLAVTAVHTNRQRYLEARIQPTWNGERGGAALSLRF